jgi:subfamily B ATP-binding cassette protein MsbA
MTLPRRVAMLCPNLASLAGMRPHSLTADFAVKQRDGKKIYSLAGLFGAYSKLITQRPRLLAAAVVLSFAAAIAEGLGLAIIYPLLDSVIGTNKLQGTLWDTLRGVALSIAGSSVTEGLLYLVVVIFFLKAILLAANVVVTSLWLNRLQGDWTLAALSHYLFGPYFTIVGQRRGKIIHNIFGETGYASKGAELLLVLATKGAFAAVLIGTLLILNWKMTAALLIFITLVTVLVRPYAIRSMHRLGQKRITTKQAMTAITAEPIFSASTVKLLGVESDVLKRLTRSQRKQIRVNVLMAATMKAPSLFAEFIVVLMVATIFIVVARVFGVALQTAAPLIGAFAIVSSRLITVLSGLFNMRLSLAAVGPSLALAERLVTTHSTSEAVTRGDVLQKVDSDIEFRNVGFAYGDGKPVFTDLSLVFPRGKLIGIVGPTGVGKSTIGYLIGRLYEPTSGSIQINGRDIREFSLQSLRRRLGFVEQTPAVFNGTIAENIGLGAPEATFTEIEEAAKAAQLHDFIMSLPEGYDTLVQDQGATLSGGERQRLAIARAIVRRPDIFVLDEGTSALDHKTEAAVQKSIQALSGEATIIMIAHRVSTLKNADLIYEVHAGGKVVARSFDEIAA